MGEQRKQILPVKPGTIAAEDKAAMLECGVIVVEHPEPAELVFLPTGMPDAGRTLLETFVRASRETRSDQSFGYFTAKQQGLVVDALLRAYGQDDIAARARARLKAKP